MSARAKRVGGEAPPLTTWYWVAGFVCALALCAAFVPGPNANVLEAYARRIDDFAEQTRGSQRPKVILLGTSLAYRAVPTGEEMTARLGDIAFLKLARPGVRFHFYDSLQDGIFDTRPDLIVLQTELFREAGLYPVTDARAALRLGIRGQWGGRKAGFDPPDFGDCAERQAPERLDAAVANLRAEFPRFGGLPRSGKRFFERAREEGVFVALLDLPRTATLEAASAGRVGRWRQEVAAALAGSAQLRVLRYDEALADEFFCDFAHLTPRGRDRFVAWFGPELRRLLDASAGGRW